MKTIAKLFQFRTKKPKTSNNAIDAHISTSSTEMEAAIKSSITEYVKSSIKAQSVVSKEEGAKIQPVADFSLSSYTLSNAVLVHALKGLTHPEVTYVVTENIVQVIPSNPQSVALFKNLTSTTLASIEKHGTTISDPDQLAESVVQNPSVKGAIAGLTIAYSSVPIKVNTAGQILKYIGERKDLTESLQSITTNTIELESALDRIKKTTYTKIATTIGWGEKTDTFKATPPFINAVFNHCALHFPLLMLDFNSIAKETGAGTNPLIAALQQEYAATPPTAEEVDTLLHSPAIKSFLLEKSQAVQAEFTDYFQSPYITAALGSYFGARKAAFEKLSAYSDQKLSPAKTVAPEVIKPKAPASSKSEEKLTHVKMPTWAAIEKQIKEATHFSEALTALQQLHKKCDRMIPPSTIVGHKGLLIKNFTPLLTPSEATGFLATHLVTQAVKRTGLWITDKDKKALVVSVEEALTTLKDKGANPTMEHLQSVVNQRVATVFTAPSRSFSLRRMTGYGRIINPGNFPDSHTFLHKLVTEYVTTNCNQYIIDQRISIIDPEKAKEKAKAAEHPTPKTTPAISANSYNVSKAKTLTHLGEIEQVLDDLVIKIEVAFPKVTLSTSVKAANTAKTAASPTKPQDPYFPQAGTVKRLTQKFEANTAIEASHNSLPTQKQGMQL